LPRYGRASRHAGIFASPCPTSFDACLFERHAQRRTESPHEDDANWLREADDGRDEWTPVDLTRVMPSNDVVIASRFRAALETAVRTGDHNALLELVAPDVEWVTPQRTLRGIDELRNWRIWGSSAEGFDFDFVDRDWVDHGDGRVVCDVHQVYRKRGTAEFAYERERRVELTIRNGKISRYEVRVVG
jgi:ketosteroid isomerase-like protein